jgi:hypothetical protein
MKCTNMLLSAAFVLSCVTSVLAAEPDPVPPPDGVAPAKQSSDPSSLDEDLLKGLDNELLEGAGKMRKPSSSNDGAAPKATDSHAETIDDTQSVEADDPLVHISQEMRQVEEYLPQAARRGHAEQLQRRIVDDLARLIDQAEQQKSQKASSSKQQKSKSTQERKQQQQPKQAKGNSGKDSNKPAEDSSNRLGKAEAARPDPELFKRMMKDTWGHLPARDREQMLQTTPDKFLPQYELMIEKYYQRLAEEPEPR